MINIHTKSTLKLILCEKGAIFVKKQNE